MRGPRSPRRDQKNWIKQKNMQFMRCTRASWTNKEKPEKNGKHTHTNEGCPKDM